MTRSVLGTLIVGVAFLPWIAEVAFQARLQARFLEALPAPDRAALPPHPRQAVLAFLGSPRFAWAVWCSFRRDTPDDPDVVRALKGRMRASLRRELAWALAGFGVLATFVATGWRPWT